MNEAGSGITPEEYAARREAVLAALDGAAAVVLAGELVDVPVGRAVRILLRDFSTMSAPPTCARSCVPRFPDCATSAMLPGFGHEWTPVQ